jgi:CheY-like chemotaxis protein
MQKDKYRVKILMVDDDEDDCLILRTAFQESSLEHDLVCFENGRKIMDYLQHHYIRDKNSDTPCSYLILLDLNMPVMDGRAVLYEIKNDPELKDIPVVVLTGSEDAVDAIQCYELGASLFYTKSQWMEILAEIIKSSGKYWFDFAARLSGKKISANERCDAEVAAKDASAPSLNPDSCPRGRRGDLYGIAP